MAGFVEKGRIMLHEQVGPEIWRMQLELPLTAKAAKPGQFIHVKVNDPRYILRRPISIAGTDAGKGLVEIIYRIVGKGTEAMSHLEALKVEKGKLEVLKEVSHLLMNRKS